VKLSVIMPARDEAAVIEPTLDAIVSRLAGEGVDFEVLVVDDGSSDGTAAAVARAAERDTRVRCVRNDGAHGFGHAVRTGLEHYGGDAVAVMMADGSDDPRDLVLYLRVLEAGYDCAFGSRFMPGAVVRDYPRVKLAINRLVNAGIRVLFRHGYNDTTNAFKAYRREVVDQLQPLISPHFNLTVEMPLKAIVRGHSYEVIPTNWTNRTSGQAKLAMKEMGSRYLFIVLYVWLENALSRGDYEVRARPDRRRRRDRRAS
jgi:dolichol-phosphate mannosyltransferase